MKKETVEKLKKLPVTNSAMAHAVSYAASTFFLILIIVTLWLKNISFQDKLPFIILPILAIDFFFINQWYKIAKREKQKDCSIK